MTLRATCRTESALRSQTILPLPLAFPILVLELVAAKRRPYAPLHPFLLSCTFADPFFTYTLMTLVYGPYGCRPPSRLLFPGPFRLLYLYLLCLAGPEKMLVMYINHPPALCKCITTHLCVFSKSPRIHQQGPVPRKPCRTWSLGDPFRLIANS